MNKRQAAQIHVATFCRHIDRQPNGMSSILGLYRGLRVSPDKQAEIAAKGASPMPVALAIVVECGHALGVHRVELRAGGETGNAEYDLHDFVVDARTERPYEIIRVDIGLWIVRPGEFWMDIFLDGAWAVRPSLTIAFD